MKFEPLFIWKGIARNILNGGPFRKLVHLSPSTPRYLKDGLSTKSKSEANKAHQTVTKFCIKPEPRDPLKLSVYFLNILQSIVINVILIDVIC